MEVLILTCGTGGGHNAAAHALQEELRRRGHGVTVLNPYHLRSAAEERLIDRVYIRMAQSTPRLFGLVYQLGNAYRRLPFRSPVYFANGKMAGLLRNYLREHPADVMICTHLYPAEIVTQMQDQGMPTPKSIFVATDYVCIPFTEETHCDAVVIPAEALRAEFVRRGIPQERLHPLGIPVRRAFCQPRSQAEARAELGLDAEATYLLLSGGSMGAGKLDKVIRQLLASCDERTHLIAVCGSNEALYQKLGRIADARLTLLHATDRLALYLQACDLYFTKPGGLSSTEAAVLGKPLVHMPPIPGCETRNAAFFEAQGMSLRIRANAADVRRAVELLRDESRRAQMLRCQRRTVPADAAGAICDLAASMLADEPESRTQK